MFYYTINARFRETRRQFCRTIDRFVNFDSRNFMLVVIIETACWSRTSIYPSSTGFPAATGFVDGLKLIGSRRSSAAPYIFSIARFTAIRRTISLTAANHSYKLEIFLFERNKTEG